MKTSQGILLQLISQIITLCSIKCNKNSITSSKMDLNKISSRNSNPIICGVLQSNSRKDSLKRYLNFSILMDRARLILKILRILGKPWVGRNKKVTPIHLPIIVQDLILQLDPNHDGTILFEEFQVVMKHIEDRL